jgi:hypothetical protein
MRNFKTLAAAIALASFSAFASASLRAADLSVANWNTPAAQEPTLDATSWAASPSIHLLLGGQEGVGGGTSALSQHTSAWEGIYEQPDILSHFGLQIRYLNEGYLGPTNVPWAIRLSQPLHYRDTYGLQLNYWSALHSDCRLGAAFGPEIYLDTTTSTYRAQYQDRHGVGLQPSLSGQCRLNSRLALEVIASRSLDVASFSATAVLLGITYTPLSVAERDDNGASNEDDSVSSRHRYAELSVGRAEVDSFHLSHEIGSAIWATYGAELRDPLSLEFSMLNERVSAILERHGAAAQLIARHEFATGGIQMFVGAGPELARSKDEANQVADTRVNLLLSYGIKIPVSDSMALVFRFGRVESSSGRNDTDLLTAGFSVNLPSGGRRP